MKLWLARHAAPQAAQGLCYGRTDLPADPRASLQAAQALAASLPPGLCVRHSPLQRCEHLAQALRGLRPDLAFRTDPRLAEMDFGDWDGLAWDGIGRDRLDAWTADFARHRPGGGESVTELMERVAAAWDEALSCGRDEAWITHAGVIRAALLLAAGRRTVSQAAEWPRDAVPFGAWRVLDLGPAIPNG